VGVETPKKVDKDKFDAVLKRLIQTPPIRSSEIVGKGKPKKEK
jgi:hypothetical protein